LDYNRCDGSGVNELILSNWRYRALVASIVAAALGYFAFSLWAAWVMS